MTFNSFLKEKKLLLSECLLVIGHSSNLVKEGLLGGLAFSALFSRNSDAGSCDVRALLHLALQS